MAKQTSQSQTTSQWLQKLAAWYDIPPAPPPEKADVTKLLLSATISDAANGFVLLTGRMVRYQVCHRGIHVKPNIYKQIYTQP